MVNKVILIGRVGKDPEARFTSGGEQTTGFSVATSEKWTAKDGQKQERTEWHRCEAWAKTAQIVSDYMVKGSLVYVEGKIRYEEWTDKEGHKRNATKIRAERVMILGDGKPREKTQTQGDEDDEVPF